MQRLFAFVFVCLLPISLLPKTGGELKRARAVIKSVLNDLTPASDASFSFNQTTRQLAHLRRPWHTWKREFGGVFALADNGESFYKIDSMRSGPSVYTSYTYYHDTLLFIIDAGKTEPQSLTQSDKLNFIHKVSALTPVFLLNDFLTYINEDSFLRFSVGEADTIMYRNADGNIATLILDASKNELSSAAIVYGHELYGDVHTTFTYSDYTISSDKGFKYAATIVERKLEFAASVVKIELDAKGFDQGIVRAKIPPTYRLITSVVMPEEVVSHTQYKPKIHLLELKQANSRSLVVEFDEYFLVAEAPLNPKNGELIISEVSQIASDKPIRYFVFGHYHPHYIGGLRAFVHKGSTVITTPGDSTYVTQIVSFKHALVPDSLTIQPRPLDLLVMVDSQMVITDGEFVMRVINIGPMSQHTDNYLIYYFPQYKLLYVDEGIWVPADIPLTAAERMQKGLYDAIMRHKLDVETILRGWPAVDSSSKSMIDFRELRESVDLIPVPNIRN